MDHGLRSAVENFFYLEAELLDDRRLREWLELFSEDARYWMPVRHNPLDRPAAVEEELSGPGDAYYFNDTKQSLALRVERVYAKNAWAEMPPSRTRHLISNVRIVDDRGTEIEVRCNFICYRTRMEANPDIFAGARRDLLRRSDGGFKIARRTIILDQAILLAKNISIFL